MKKLLIILIIVAVLISGCSSSYSTVHNVKVESGIDFINESGAYKNGEKCNSSDFGVDCSNIKGGK